MKDINFICTKCAHKHCTMKRKPDEGTTWNMLGCDICGSNDPVTEPRDFGGFKIKSEFNYKIGTVSKKDFDILEDALPNKSKALLDAIDRPAICELIETTCTSKTLTVPQFTKILTKYIIENMQYASVEDAQQQALKFLSYFNIK